MADANPFSQYLTQDAVAPAADAGANPFSQYVEPDDQLAPQHPLMTEKQNIAKGVVRGLQDIPEGGAQFVTHGIADLSPEGSSIGSMSKSAGDTVDKYIKDQEDAYKKSLGGKEPSLDIGRSIGNMAAGAPVAYLMPGAAAESLAGRIGSGIASGAVSGAMQPVDTAKGDYWGQKGMQTGAGAVGGAIAPAVAGTTARTISPNVSPNVKLLMNEGVTPTPGQIAGGWFGDLEEKFGSIPGVGDAIKSARRRATDDMNRAAINRSLSNVGEKLDPNTPLGRDAISEMHDKVSSAYDKLLPNLTWQADPTFVGNVSNIASGAHLLPEQEKQFASIVRDQMSKVSSNGTMPGDTYKEVESKLKAAASNYSNTSDPDKRNLGKALQQVQVEMRSALKRSNPQYAPELDKVDAAYADALRVQGAAGGQGAAEGVFSGPQLSASVRQMDPSLRKGAFARGEARMQDLSDAAKSVLGNKVPDSGTAGRSLMALAALGAAGGGGASHIIPHSSMVLPAAAAGVAGMGAYTRPGQATLAALLARRPDVAAPIASVVRKAAPLGSSGLASVLASQANP
jgi:hypothetical protein